MSAEPFLGDVEIVAGNYASKGWAMCIGQSLPINDNTALFSIISNIYGGDGRTTMALPDIRGRAPIGFGKGLGLSNYEHAERGGNEFNNITSENLPPTENKVSLPSSAQSVSVSIPGQTISGVTGSANIATTQNANSGEPTAGAVLAAVVPGGGPDKQEKIYQSTAPSSLISIGNVTVDTFNVPAQENIALTLPANSLEGMVYTPGGRAPLSNNSPFIAMNYVIALQGIYPSRS
ncbi:hypothetical protein EU508_20530 [Pseudoalteromonas fuliginea]|uniref:Phage tail collar domain-containing protein n=1 Tax=Pseudoalteromonas fuliginea TaxID=1872678 RepID=A0AB73BBP9_9GAMM|nr:tail fiber protein [Pseudoalteromonas fuliginea]KAA1156473.1 hypothetical protein EU508_20530 [Pseudoalteromonas fuliginea]